MFPFISVCEVLMNGVRDVREKSLGRKVVLKESNGGRPELDVFRNQKQLSKMSGERRGLNGLYRLIIFD